MLYSKNVDDFDDFQSAPPSAGLQSPVTIAVASPAAKPSLNVFDILGQTSATASPITPTALPQYSAGSSLGFGGAPPMQAQAAAKPNYGHAASGSFSMLSPTSTTSNLSSRTPTSPPAAPKSSGNFDDLWSMSIGGSSTTSAKPAAANGGKSIKQMEQEKASAGMWGAAPATNAQGQGQGGSGFGSSGGGFGNGGDDLLL